VRLPQSAVELARLVTPHWAGLAMERPQMEMA
jgi:hypothetical protein